jgi:hypothetical protein
MNIFFLLTPKHFAEQLENTVLEFHHTHFLQSSPLQSETGDGKVKFVSRTKTNNHADIFWRLLSKLKPWFI